MERVSFVTDENCVASRLISLISSHAQCSHNSRRPKTYHWNKEESFLVDLLVDLSFFPLKTSKCLKEWKKLHPGKARFSYFTTTVTNYLRFDQSLNLLSINCHLFSSWRPKMFVFRSKWKRFLRFSKDSLNFLKRTLRPKLKKDRY